MFHPIHATYRQRIWSFFLPRRIRHFEVGVEGQGEVPVGVAGVGDVDVQDEGARLEGDAVDELEAVVPLGAGRVVVGEGQGDLEIKMLLH